MHAPSHHPAARAATRSLLSGVALLMLVTLVVSQPAAAVASPGHVRAEVPVRTEGGGAVQTSEGERHVARAERWLPLTRPQRGDGACSRRMPAHRWQTLDHAPIPQLREALLSLPPPQLA